MTYPPVDYPWLWQWWQLQYETTDTAAPVCAVCARSEGLVLVDRDPYAEMTSYDNLTPACSRCADRIVELVAERTAPGRQWAGMPQQIAVPKLIRELATGRTPIRARV